MSADNYDFSHDEDIPEEENTSMDLTDKSKKGDDTMSASTQNFVYEVCGKKNHVGKEPTVSKDRMERIKVSIGKYLFDKKK